VPQDLAESGSQQASQGALDALSALPVGAHLTVVVAILVGLALWLFGRKLAKPAFLLVGGLLGAAAGFLLLPAFGTPAIAEVPSPYIGLGVGAAAGLIVAGFVFRFTMALASAAVVGIAALLISSIYVTANPPDPDQTTAVSTPALASIAPPLTLYQLRLPGVPTLDRGRAIPVGRFQPESDLDPPAPADPLADPADLPATSEAEPSAPDSLEDTAQRVRDFLAVLSSEIRLVWNSQPEEGRLIVLGSTVIGAALGFIIGLAAPNRAAIVITSMAGAAIWLPSAVALAHALQTPFRDALVWGPRAWLIAWLVTSAIGVASQLVLARRRGNNDDGEGDDSD
jgi:hypothetical protein